MVVINLRFFNRVTSTTLVVAILACAIFTPACHTKQPTDEWIKRLCSEEKTERENAKKALIDRGSSSIPPLVSLLRCIIKRTMPEFGVKQGKEEPDDAEECPPDLIIEPSVVNMNPDVPTWQLKRDVIEVLGKLKAVEAVPLLIKLEESEPARTRREKVNPVMSALVEIGPPAVDKLLEMLEDSISFVHSLEEERNSGTLEAQDYERIISRNCGFQATIILALGKIGEARSLLALNNMSKAPHEKALDYYLEEAIKTIKEKNNIK